MGFEKGRRIWPDHTYHVFTTRATGEQRIRWLDAASLNTMKPHMGLFLSRAADHYAAYLQRQRKRALAKQDKEDREREGKP